MKKVSKYCAQREVWARGGRVRVEQSDGTEAAVGRPFTSRDRWMMKLKVREKWSWQRGLKKEKMNNEKMVPKER